MKARPYTIKDAKLIFPGLADGVVQKWRDKGLLSFDTAKHGVGILIKYSLDEVLHLGVINQLSLLGVLKIGAKKLSIAVDVQNIPLTDPSRLIEHYSRITEDSLLTICLYEEPIAAYYRNRRAEVKCRMRLLSSGRTHGDDCHDSDYTTAIVRIGKIRESCLNLGNRSLA